MLDKSRECARASDLQKRGRLVEAAAVYEVVLRAAPEDLQALRGLGRVRLRLGDARSAAELLGKAVAIQPESAEDLADLGAALSVLNRQEEALQCCSKALAIDPARAGTHSDVGTILTTLGRIDEGIRALERATRLDPSRPGYYWNLVMSKRSSLGDPHIAAMEDLARRIGDLTPPRQVELHFALAKVMRTLASMR
jgi:tetratricopeptide (TPR) repeat protein